MYMNYKLKQKRPPINHRFKQFERQLVHSTSAKPADGHLAWPKSMLAHHRDAFVIVWPSFRLNSVDHHLCRPSDRSFSIGQNSTVNTLPDSRPARFRQIHHRPLHRLAAIRISVSKLAKSLTNTLDTVVLSLPDIRSKVLQCQRQRFSYQFHRSFWIVP